MAASIHDLLRPITFTKTISVVSAASSSLLNFFGMQVGGPNERFYGHGREGSYHIFNNTRSTALETAPDMPAARRPVLPVGRVPFVYPRMFEEFSLSYEVIHNFAKIDDPRARDIAGESYIARQSVAPGQRHANWRTALLVGMLRDSLYLQESGNYWYPTYSSSGNVARRNFQLPAGNKSQLNITDVAGNSIYGGNIIDVPWSSGGANIPLQVARIDAALFRRHGVHLRHIYLRSETWDMVTNNSYVAAGAGISNPPFQVFTRQVGQNPDGSPMQEWTGTVNKVPGVTWHICNDGRDLGIPGSESWNYDIEDNCALFLPEPTSDLFEGLIGSEPVVERENEPAKVKQGYSAWTNLAANPSRYQAFQLDNFLPCPYVPGSWCYGNVAGF
jgi:hypothetical protein